MSEFLNHHLVRYFTDHPQKPAFTRSRPYKKNDNAHVAQKLPVPAIADGAGDK